MSKLTHLDDAGAARMVDVSAKDMTVREASAEATIVLSAEAFEAVVGGTAKKGDVIAAARIAGIMAAKKTSELIPLCHQLPLSHVGIEFEIQKHGIEIVATARTAAQTGVEMEAMTAAAVASLAMYDMLKSVEKGIAIENVRLIEKRGGKSGVWRAARSKP